MNAIEDNEFSRAWVEAGKALPRPSAILSISAHWESDGTLVTAMEQPKTIYDFYGFPESLYEVSRAGFARVRSAHSGDSAEDAGAFGSSLGARPRQMDRFMPDVSYGRHTCRPTQSGSNPTAAVPLRTWERTVPLRNKGILIVGSGNIVHNLGMMAWQGKAYDWAIEFDEAIKRSILSGDHASIIHYQDLGQAARLSVPTNEHYLPLLYALPLQDEQERIRFFADGVTHGSISMRSLWIQ